MSNSASIIELLKREVVPATGCTEPIAVAFGAARACEILGTKPQRMSVKLSANLLKNAMGVGIPGTGMVGLPIAISLGVIVGKSTYGLEVLQDTTPADIELAKEYLATNDIEIQLFEDAPDKLYIDITAATQEHRAHVVIAKEHTNIVVEELDSETIHKVDITSSDEALTNDAKLSMRTIYDFAMQTPLKDIEFILEAGRLNSLAAKFALDGDFGHKVGKIVTSECGRALFGESKFTEIISFTTAACDARMAGAMIPVMSNSGSGNQGIAATLPVYMYAKQSDTSDEQLSRALILSSLTAIYIKQHLGRLSALCGCVVAATGSSCGITMLMGGGYEEVTFAVKNMVANLTGMICDGAKPSCSLKLASGVSTALLSALLALEGRSVSAVEGIVDEDVDQCLVNLAKIGRDSMTETDREVLNIMTSKQC